MTKEALEKEAEKHADGIYHYKINVSDYGEDGIINYRYSDIKEAYIKGAEPREKQIQIDAEQIRALQKQNGELTDELKTLRESIKNYGAGCYENGLRNGKRAAEKVKVVEHFEAYGQCRDSRRIAELEAQIEKMRNCANCKNYNGNEGFCVLGSGYGYNCNLEKWEIKENDRS